MEERRKMEKKKVMEKKGRDVSKSETTANKSQSVALLEGDAWIISQSQVKWLPVSPTSLPKKETPPLCSLLLNVPPILSCRTVFSSTSSHRCVAVRGCGEGGL